jgi:soluble lytic murein transglycosylase-like protein
LILSVIRVESAFKQEAISGTQKGNMQIVVPLHRKRFHGRNPMILAVNIDVGTEILSECLVRKHGNINKTARCYNGGGDPAYEVKIRQALIELKTVEL